MKCSCELFALGGTLVERPLKLFGLGGSLLKQSCELLVFRDARRQGSLMLALRLFERTALDVLIAQQLRRERLEPSFGFFQLLDQAVTFRNPLGGEEALTFFGVPRRCHQAVVFGGLRAGELIVAFFSVPRLRQQRLVFGGCLGGEVPVSLLVAPPLLVKPPPESR